MRFIIVRWLIIKPAVFHDDLTALICLTRRDANLKRIAVGVKAVLDGIFNQRLQRQGRNVENQYTVFRI